MDIGEKEIKYSFLPKTCDKFDKLSENKIKEKIIYIYNSISFQKISKLLLFIICIIILFISPTRKILDVLYISGCNRENLREEYIYNILNHIK